MVEQMSAGPAGSGSETSAPGWLRRLWSVMLTHRTDVFLAVLAAIMGSACQTVVPLIARQIVDQVVIRHSSPLWPWLTALIALGAAIFGFAYLRRFRGGRVALNVQFDLRNAMHDHLQTLDADTLSHLPTGQLVARANSDSALVQGLLSFFPIMSGNVLMMVLSLIVMLYLSPLLALVALLVAPALLFSSYRMRRRIFPASWDGQQREGDVAQIVDEDVNGVRLVKAFGQERRELERVVNASQALYGSQMRTVRLQARYQPLLEAIPAIAQVAILALGGWMALHHDITIGTFLAFSTYVAQFAAPARQLAGILTVGQQARAGIERIFQLIDLKPAIADAPDAYQLGTIRGEVSFDSVDFRYGTSEPALRDFTLRVAAGERVALVGPSGSGKSSAAMLVSRFYDPTAGVVRVDGHDVREVSLQSLRRQIGMVFEESFLFSDSVRANIAYGRPGASRSEVEAAARAAAAHEFICDLPRGYDTVVGERGLTLSGGQRQRIALARAILIDPRILVLDDATSAIDARIEEQIYQALRVLLVGRTTLIIAHRLSTLRLADRIVMLDQGRITAQGTHAELVERSEAYRRLLAGLDDAVGGAIGDIVDGAVGTPLEDETVLAPSAASARTPRASASAWDHGPTTRADSQPRVTGA
ncbi:MAG: ABC transporter ATP-binding protein/permease, partial [Actinomycetota bacterium]|nr:ABC transporter ATP-binding protein/permease [Actinomycetota bacterium]